MNDVNAQIGLILNNVSATDANSINLNSLKYQQLQQYMLFQRFFRTRATRVPTGIGNLTPELELLLQHLYDKSVEPAKFKFNNLELENKIFNSLEIINY